MLRGPIAEISLSALLNNLKTIKSIVRDRHIIPVVKADAYGHGSIEISRLLLKHGVEYLAVAFTGEARILRESGINCQIIVLFDRDACECIELNLIPVIHSIEAAHEFSREARKRNAQINVHVKIDTGMGRLGLTGEHIMDGLLTISKMPGIKVTGIISHFSEADLKDRTFALQQLNKFISIRDMLSSNLNRYIFSYIANSAAVMSFPEAYLDAVRPGIMLYGYSPLSYDIPADDQKFYDKLIPVMSVKTKILNLRNVPAGTPISYGRTFTTKRKSKIGVIPLGYADGFNRLFSNNAEVLVRGRRVPVVGRVCMDMTMIDVTEIKDIKEEDEVVIIGSQGQEKITAYELAERANTITYEILTSLGSRARRIYV
ncbi:MAG: alanine racemase [Nitrospirae bacterium]|nr:alanine racemase [Nitrospirota bacterium]